MNGAPKVLFYYGANLRSVAIETQILALRARGIAIELLTTAPPGPLHERLAAEGIPVHAHVLPKGSSALWYLRQLAFLVRFARAGGFTAVFPNSHACAFVAVLAQPFLAARVVVFRHHFTFAGESGPGRSAAGDGKGGAPSAGGSAGEGAARREARGRRRERLLDRVIHALARRIVVPSGGVYQGMLEREGADPAKLEIVPYVYDFERYAKPDPEAVAALRSAHPARLRLLIASRMVPAKRHLLAFEVVERLVREGLDLVLFVLDDGPERASLERSVRERGLDGRIVLLGFRDDFVNVMAASDLLLHPSLTEASSSVVKEMGLVGRPVIACAGVGDFDDYLVDGRNAFVVPRATTGREIEEAIRAAYADPERLAEMGRAHREIVLERFGVNDRSMRRYVELVMGALRSR